MSNETATLEHGADHDEHDGDHLTFSGAIRIAVVLAVITAIETLTYFVDFGSLAEPVIIVSMILKFAIVVGYFMHLKFDNKMFTVLFAIGMALTLAVYFITLFAMNFYG